MKKTSRKTIAKDEMRPEYDLSGGVRNRYAKQLREEGYTLRVYHRDGTVTEKRVSGAKTITLAPDVQKYFPTSQAVNRALRTLISIIPEKRKTAAKKAAGGRKSASRRTLKA
jgi:hypothetical protein